MPPIRFGMKKTVRNMFVPLMFCVSAYAAANASTFIAISDTTANRAVYQKACINDGSEKALA